MALGVEIHGAIFGKCKHERRRDHRQGPGTGATHGFALTDCGSHCCPGKPTNCGISIRGPSSSTWRTARQSGTGGAHYRRHRNRTLDLPRHRPMATSFRNSSAAVDHGQGAHPDVLLCRSGGRSHNAATACAAGRLRRLQRARKASKATRTARVIATPKAAGARQDCPGLQVIERRGPYPERPAPFSRGLSTSDFSTLASAPRRAQSLPARGRHCPSRRDALGKHHLPAASPMLNAASSRQCGSPVKLSASISRGRQLRYQHRLNRDDRRHRHTRR